MLIDKISVRNFRVYHGSHDLSLSINPEKHVTVISGQNGFGKTSLLTSLVWVLYGKLMTDVDERYRKEIYESGGYKKYATKLMNRPALEEAHSQDSELKRAVQGTNNVLEKENGRQKIAEAFSFSVTVYLTNIFIPHLSCKQVSIKRTYHIISGNETIEILIDGKPNELTKTIGTEIFINDFILPKEIAKFFFFDAEKITALAEVKSLEEKQYFSKAYTEVLGIKKYTDLKSNLENLLLRISKKSADKADLKKIETHQQKLIENNNLLELYQNNLIKKEQEWIIKKSDFSEIQERLVRAGSAMSFEELQEFKKIRIQLKEEIVKNKNRFNDLLELAPFAMLARKMHEVRRQLNLEERQAHHQLISNLMQEKYNALLAAFNELPEFNSKKIENILAENLVADVNTEQKVLLNFNSEQHNLFNAVMDNLGNVYSKQFKTLVADGRRLQSTYNITQKKVQDAEAKADDPVIKALKETYISLQNEINTLENSILDIKVKIGILEKEIIGIKRQLSEQTKHIRIEESDQLKAETAERLIKQLETFIYQLKQKKKGSLEKNIKKELNRLMHKSDFVERVEVKVEGDLIDVDLYDFSKSIINKDSLSKGEQQLYATALLKALITESNIQFPVFIDSPLQKLDKLHAGNIIKDFYPTISSQVVVFPLLEKELNFEEYLMLLPKVGKSYLITQTAPYKSKFSDVSPEVLFDQFNNLQRSYVQ
ncbi:DNA sulfur modification protein DndD [Mucilaginibacter sp. OK268]|uniref:AAA family ATPase n=1 Tax=Mucilaginibacter sp. OK268 TaxID=1881048 RepID=UPI000888A89B|nr:AAA family ATPase [Mucilaginibacter sp. OK268]SDP45810.1 DNA sulfur modification protein DndD [Mucilaginibacter sp. OK268]